MIRREYIHAFRNVIVLNLVGWVVKCQKCVPQKYHSANPGGYPTFRKVKIRSLRTGRCVFPFNEHAKFQFAGMIGPIFTAEKREQPPQGITVAVNCLAFQRLVWGV